MTASMSSPTMPMSSGQLSVAGPVDFAGDVAADVATERVGIRHWGLATVLAAVFALAVAPAVDPDLFWHLATGRLIVRTHHVPLADPFSWTVPGRRWIAHEWLTEVAFHGLYRLGSWPALVLSAAIVITLGWLVVHRTARNLGARAGWSGFMMALAALSSVHTWGVRPQMLSLLLSAAAMQRLQRWHVGLSRRVPWELAFMCLLWANLHGGFIFGVVMVVIFAIGTTLETLVSPRFAAPFDVQLRGGRAVRSGRDVADIWALAVACTLATLVTPNGLAGLLYPFTYLGNNASTRYVGEWFAPRFTNPQFWPFALLVGLAGLALVRGRRHLGITELGLMVPFCALGIQSVRNITLAAIICAPIVATAFTRRDDVAFEARQTRLAAKRAWRATAPGARRDVTPQQATRIVGSFLGLAIVALIAFTTGDLRVGATTSAQAKTQSPAAAQWLIAHPGGHLLNHYNFGGWLISHDIAVYVDGRPDMYGDAYMDQYVRMVSMKGDWRAEMASRSIDRVLMPPANGLLKVLRKDPSWQIQTEDAAAVLLVHR